MIDAITKCYSNPASSDYSIVSSNIRFSRIFEGLNINETKVLDYGCGPGNMASWFSRNNQKPALYHGYDIREETITIAQQRNPTYQFSTALCLDFVFDIAVFAGTISYAFDDDITKCKKIYEHEIVKAMGLLHPQGFIRATARKIGYEYERKQNKRMLTYSVEDLERLGASSISSLFDHEWIFDIKKEK